MKREVDRSDRGLKEISQPRLNGLAPRVLPFSGSQLGGEITGSSRLPVSSAGARNSGGATGRLPATQDQVGVASGSVLVLGAGGHAKVVIELLRSSGHKVLGLLDADTQQRCVLGAWVLGNDEMLKQQEAGEVTRAFVAIGDNHVRAHLGARLKEMGYALVNAISPYASISPSARIGEGVAVMGGAVINAEADIGDFAIVNTGAVVEHDCVLEPACHLGPRVALAGGVKVGAGAFLGVGVSVIPGVVIGSGSIVGAGAAVVSDIPAGVMAWGVPARVGRKLGCA
jgi:UDP-perosamine 4-acetyltransferase